MEHSLSELLAGLASPDPSVRDGWAYQELSDGIASGRFSDGAAHHTWEAHVRAATGALASRMTPWLLEPRERPSIRS